MTLFNSKTNAFKWVIVLLFGFGYNLSIQAQSGCTDALACNFDETAVTDDGSCFYSGYFIPLEPGDGPALQACEAPPGYFFADPDCVESVINSDLYCIDTSWDLACQNAYDACIGCSDPVIFIPYEVGSGPAVYGCGYPPDGYYFPNQFCVQEIVDNDPFCLYLAWDEFCQADYDAFCFGCESPGCTDPVACNYDPLALCDDFSCIFGDQYYIPVSPGLGPLVLACEAPANYMLASQACASAIAELDPYCLEEFWDGICQDEYNSCLMGTFSAAQGCTYPSAPNYNPSATIDDGSCFFPVDDCAADINNDGVVNTGDLSVVLAEFGSFCGIIILNQAE